MAPRANKIRLSKGGNSAGKVRFWKPTVAESREGIIVQAKIPGDIQRIVDFKRKRMLDMGLHLQPFIILIGKDFTNIQKAYVRIDSVSYELPSLLKALDLLFKIYLVFNLQYPLECENFCYLIQWGLYEIRTKSDEQIPFVFNTLNQMKREDKKMQLS
ncbi:uncharacterized protein LOC118740385 [Rhagoletis pomonella]|uniref:uncharacterized protein LOC118740385 n=1 Tax=Rhagoletis pomonella TaxID=28610 RepID=UPI001781E792|nr:uncharacterized protein LOC118740385 [Rhagoletis pomonella]